MKEIKKIALFGLGSINWIGGVQYISNIIYALDQIAEEHSLEIHLIKSERQAFTDIDKFRNNKIIIADVDEVFPPWSIPNRVKWFLQRKIMRRIVPRKENYFIRNNFDFVYPNTISDANRKLNVASWIADFQYYYYPEGASAEFTQAAYDEISFTAHYSPKIVLSSLACERNCNEIFPETIGKTYSMPFTVFVDRELLKFNDFSSIMDKYQIPENFIIVSNSFCPTKNHKTIFKALNILNEEGVKVNLVCTGNILDQRNLHFASEVLQMVTEYRVRGQVYLLGIVPRADQIAIYRMAKAVVQPSLNEGWSTSVEEAKCLGKHLIVSDIDVHKEQCEGNPNMFQKLDAEDLAGVIKRIWVSTQQQRFPDQEREKSAFDSYQVKVKIFGKRFLEIAERFN